MNKNAQDTIYFGDEISHNQARYETLGFVDFQRHAKQYLAGERAISISKTQSFHGKDITFTFSDELLKEIVGKNNCLEKAYEVAIKYGFQGYSNGGRNGIFYQRNVDIGMIATTSRIIQRNKEEIINDLEIDEEGLDALRKVKIVWHNPTGERIIGVYNKNNNRAIFLDLIKY